VREVALGAPVEEEVVVPVDEEVVDRVTELDDPAMVVEAELELRLIEGERVAVELELADVADVEERLVLLVEEITVVDEDVEGVEEKLVLLIEEITDVEVDGALVDVVVDVPTTPM
jgi:hypothetical protein